MAATLSDELAEVFRHAEKHPLVADRGTSTVLDRAGVEQHLPQRDPFMFIDRVTLLDLERELIVARYDLARAEQIFAGHFPGRPLFPGVLQVETIGQAGIVLGCAQSGSVVDFALTHVLAARFIRPVAPGGEIEVIARAFDDGLFRTIIGQILRDGQICSVAAVSGVDA